MSPRQIIYHPDAIQEAEAAGDWYEKRSFPAAHAFQYELNHAMDRIAENPESGPRIEGKEEIRRLLLRQYPYFLVYRKKNSYIQILAVVHSKRKPDYWRDRLN